MQRTPDTKRRVATWAALAAVTPLFMPALYPISGNRSFVPTLASTTHRIGSVIAPDPRAIVQRYRVCLAEFAHSHASEPGLPIFP